MKGTLMEHWIGLAAIFATVGVGLLTLWAIGDVQRKKFLHDKIEAIDKKHSLKIEKCRGDHVHQKFCDERSGQMKKDIEDQDHKIERLQTR